LANYLYKTILFKETANVVSLPHDNATNLADFQANYEADVVLVDNVIPAETTFEIWKSYTDFKALINEWTDVKCIDINHDYTLFLMSDTAL